jgi:predicted permease
MLILHIVEIVFPLIAVVSVGALAGWHHQPEMEVANRLNMDYFVPALIFGVLAEGDFRIVQFAGLAFGTFILISGFGIVGLVTAKLSGVKTRTLVPPMMFNNCGNLGLPLALLAFGQSAMPAAVVMFLVSTTLHFSFGVWLLNHQARLRDLWKIPVLFSAVLGLCFNYFGIHIWTPLMTAVHLLGEVSVPLMMFALGVKLADISLDRSYLGILIAVMRPVAGIVIAYLVGMWLNLVDVERAQLIMFGSLPPAVLNYIFAERYSQEPEKVASIVMIGNVSAVISIPLALMLVLPH